VSPAWINASLRGGCKKISPAEKALPRSLGRNRRSSLNTQKGGGVPTKSEPPHLLGNPCREKAPHPQGGSNTRTHPQGGPKNPRKEVKNYRRKKKLP